MLLCLGQGITSYVSDALVGHPQDGVSLDYLAFLQCYARGLGAWEIITFFSLNSDAWCPQEKVAQATRCGTQELAETLSDLADRHLLEQRILVTGPEYRLTEQAHLRRAVVQVGYDWWALLP